MLMIAMPEVGDDRVVERPAAPDVHKAQVTACVRTPGEAGQRVQEVREFKTTVRGLLALRDWLASLGVTTVAMEATGVYWWCRCGRSWRTTSSCCWSRPPERSCELRVEHSIARSTGRDRP